MIYQFPELNRFYNKFKTMNPVIYTFCDDDTQCHGYTNGEKWNGFTKIWVDDDGLNEIFQFEFMEYYPCQDEYEELGQNPVKINRNNMTELFNIIPDNGLYLLDGYTTDI